MKTRNTSLRCTIAAAWLVAGVALGGCTSGGAADLLSTAELEEVQQNIPHARELYAEIIAKYPESPEATQARARLAALNAGGGAAGQGAPAAGAAAGERIQ